MIELKRKLPLQAKISTYTLMPIFIAISFTAFFDTKQPDVAMLFLGAAFIFWLINLWPLRGYRLGWDEERLYMRDQGFKRWPFIRHDWVSIAYHDIAFIEEKFDSRGAAKVHFMPFETLEIYSKEDEMIWIHPPCFHNHEIRELLNYINDYYPGLLSDNVVDNYLNNPEMKLI